MDFYGINLKDDVSAEGTPDIGTLGNPMGTLYGVSTSSKWGDLAEKYTCKGDCSVGTVMCISKELKVDSEPSYEDLSLSVIGVISINPGFKMNDKKFVGKFIGLTGRLPVKIIGRIDKGDFIVPTINGYARAGKPEEISYKIGISNEYNSAEEIKLVECIIK